MLVMLNIQQHVCRLDKKKRSKKEQNTNKSPITTLTTRPQGSCCYCASNKRGESGSRGLRGTAKAAGGPIQGAVLAGGFTGQQRGSGSPASLRPEQGALALRLRGRGALEEERGQGGHWRRVLPCLLLRQRVRLRVTIRWRAGHALLLPPPRVVVGGVADVVVDKGVGLLAALIHLVFAVAAL